MLMGCTVELFDMNSGRLDAEARERRLHRARLEEGSRPTPPTRGPWG